MRKKTLNICKIPFSQLTNSQTNIPQLAKILVQGLTKTSIEFLVKEIILYRNTRILSAESLPQVVPKDSKAKSKVRILINNFLIFSGSGNPGPGHYDKRSVSMSTKGKYFVSKMKNSGAGFFGKSKRKIGALLKGTPGPGSYRMPSDFGIYEASAPKKSKRNRIRSAPTWKMDLSQHGKARSSRRPQTSGNGKGRRNRSGRRNKSRPQTSQIHRRSRVSSAN